MLLKYLSLIGILFISLTNGSPSRHKREDTPSPANAIVDQDQDGKYTGGYDDDCSENTFVTPHKKTVKIEPDSDVMKKKGIRCHWNVFGTDLCIPVIECSKFKLQEDKPGAKEPCTEEYLEVTDGQSGFERFCGTQGPVNRTTSRGFRDLYITYKASDTPLAGRAIKCVVRCDNIANKGKPLEGNMEPDLRKDCYCGRKPNKNRIVGGEDAKKGEFPWIVALVTANTRQPYCGGTIINDRFILTAAHCFKGAYLKKTGFNILSNAHDLDFTVTTGGGQITGEASAAGALEAVLKNDTASSTMRYFVEKFFIHPLYVRQTNDYDVALIKTTEKIDFKKLEGAVVPVCMPIPAIYNRTYEGLKATVAGWGLNSSVSTSTMGILQKLEVNVFTVDECKKFFDTKVNRRMMCAGHREAGKDSCKGDSGGPLVSEQSTQVYEIIGTVSWGEECAKANSPGVYIKVGEVSQWIRYISNLEGANWCPAK